MLSTLFTLTSLVMGMNGNGDYNFVQRAVSVILPNEASLPHRAPKKVRGTLTLEIMDTFETRIFGEIIGLKANSVHGFHIHEYGDMSSYEHGLIDCVSTGAHYNPFHKLHGGPNDQERHVGDLGNIRSNKKGIAFVDITLNGENNVVGRAFVIHELADDLSPSSATGNAGGRLACGVISIAAANIYESSTSTTREGPYNAVCIGQSSNIAFEYIRDSPSLGREQENSVIKCTKWMINEENKCGKYDNCVSIEIVNPNPRFENQYLGADIVGENGFLSDIITESELWRMDLVNPVGVEEYVFFNLETKQFLCAQLDLIQTQYLLEFRSNGGSDECHWQLKH